MKPILRFSLALLILGPITSPSQEELNIARPEMNPYVDPTGAREGREHHEVLVNEFRVYDFYGRQADHYMTREARPSLIPAFPGLDAGLHGHWGKHNQNQHKDGRWNQIKMGSVLAHTVKSGKTAFGKGVAVRLGNSMTACFDPETLSYGLVWKGDFVTFDPFRWGGSRGASADGDVWFANKDKVPAWTLNGEPLETRYHGFYRHGERAIFSYEVNGFPVLTSPSASSTHLILTFSFPEGFSGGEFRLGELPEFLSTGLVGSPVKAAAVTSAFSEERVASFSIGEQNTPVQFAMLVGPSAGPDRVGVALNYQELSPLIHGGPAQWPQTISVSGTLAEEKSRPYVIDTITVPESTPFDSVMQLTSLAFRPDGVALVATYAGEMWAVSGIDDSLKEVSWRRVAAGLHQPVGIHIDEDGIFVLERGQITRLHDLNDDGEYDFYENWANDFDGRDKSHTHSFGLVRDEDGAFYFVNWKDILRTGPDRTTQHYAFGVRNCMGFGTGAEGTVLAGPQEGTYTPTSMVIDVREGEYYGHPGDNPGSRISPPLCFVPRGIDNSTGGFLATTSDRWGPLGQGYTLGFSYGYATHYLILRDDSAKRHQGAVVPLEGDFLSGIMRGAFSPIDGQLYVVGIDGWGDYSVSDGCLQRLRYTGAKLRKAIGFQVHSNGIRIDFSTKLDRKTATSLRNYFVHQWNYEYSNQYGSPEYSVKQPDSLGHDVINVCSVQLLENESSIFVEIPWIETAMQMHLRMHLKDQEGTEFKADLFPSIISLGEHFEHPEVVKPQMNKETEITLRVDIPEDAGKLITESGVLTEGAREIVLECSSALKFASHLIEAKAGEPIKLVFKNPDIMPHNVIFVTEGHLKRVGDLSFSMLNDPKAAQKHYTPDVPEVIAGTFLVQPGGQHTLHFNAPEEPGDHHFVCTFPGHWMTMNGIFRVVE